MVYVDDLTKGETGAPVPVTDSDSAEKGSIRSETARI